MPSKPTGRAPGNPNWKPGVSGNPSGRPKGWAEIQALARVHAPHAVERLAELVDSADEKVAVAAAQAILDRGYGKPRQALEVTGEDGGPLQIQAPDLLAALRRLAGS